MTFEEFWLTLLPAEVDELKPVFEACWIEAWTSGAKEEREACAKLAMTEAALQHELDTVRNPRAAVMHSPDAAKWKKMAAMIRMRSNAS